MPKIKQIDIPSPCVANWQDMVPQNGGRHCFNCNKMVIDFTVMPESKIIEYLSRHKNVCGQFYNHQLNTINRNLAYDRRIYPAWRKLMAAACIAGLLSIAKAEASPTTPIEQVSAPKKDERKPAKDSTMVLKGKVVDKTSGQPLKNAAVYINGTGIGTETDELGEFILIVPINTSYLMVFAYKPGPITISLTSTNQKYLDIILPSSSHRIINALPASNDWVVRGEIRTKPGQKFNKENLIKIRSAKEIGRLGDFDEEMVKKPINSIQTLFTDGPFIKI